MPVLLAAAFFLLGSRPEAPPLDKRVAFFCRATPTSTLLGQLSAVAGMALSSTAEMDREVLVVSADDVPLGDLMKRIAVATGGEWDRRGSGYVLEPDVARRKQEESEAYRRTVETIQASIERDLAADSASDDPPTIPQLAKLLGAENLAKFADGERQVYARDPNPVQRPLPPAAAPILEQAIRSESQEIQALEGTAHSGKEVVSVSRSGECFTVELEFLDANGRIADYEVDMFGPGWPADSDSKTSTKPSAGAQTPVPLNADSATVAGFYAASELPVSPELRNKLTHPDRFDPLGFFETDQVLALAKALSRPVVADLPDPAFSAPIDLPLTVEGYREGLEKEWRQRIVPDDSWLVIRPADPPEARRRRVDRRALAKLAAADWNGGARLDDCADYAKAAPLPRDDVDVLTLTMAAPSVMLDDDQQDLLLLYGSFPPALRSAFLSSRSVPFASLPQAPLESILFGSNVRIQSGQGDSVQSFEPTEIMPNGIPSDGFLEIRSQTGAVVSSVRPDAFTGLTISPRNLAHLLSGPDDPPSVTSATKLRVGRTNAYLFIFHLAPGVTLTNAIAERLIPADAPWCTLDSLPPEMREAMRDERKKIEAAKNAGTTDTAKSPVP